MADDLAAEGAGDALAVGGLHEVWIGVTDLDRATDYWRAFGYQPTDEVVLEAGLASELYSHASRARVRRLKPLADHGLIRLMAWESPANPGLGTTGLNAAGTRWVGQFARSLLRVINHAEAGRAAGMPLTVGDIHFIDMGRAYAHLFDGRVPVPFRDELLALRECQIFGPETRQVILERFGYDSPLLGTFADDSLLQTTQIVQGSMVVRSDDPEIFAFYERVLGLRKSLDLAIPWERAQASRAIFALTEGETHYNVDLDEPRSGPGLAERRSGRLKIFRFGSGHAMPDVHDRASPGVLGLSNYSWLVRDIGEAHARASRIGATGITPILADEFGRRAFTCRAPDGYLTTLIEAPVA